MKKIINFALAIFLSLQTQSFAMANDQSAKVQKFIEHVGNGIIAIAKEEGLKEKEKKDKIINLIDESIDAKWIASFVLSKNYRKASKVQKEKFISLYREFMINTYGPKFKNYNGKSFSVTKVDKRGRYHIAQAEFMPADSNVAISVNFRVKERKGKLVILDFIAEGISLIETQRSEFNSAISRKGIDGFLVDLEKRVERLKK
jgi:phospholipid transport system substrate-binding protein